MRVVKVPAGTFADDLRPMTDAQYAERVDKSAPIGVAMARSVRCKSSSIYTYALTSNARSPWAGVDWRPRDR